MAKFDFEGRVSIHTINVVFLHECLNFTLWGFVIGLYFVTINNDIN